MRLLDLLMSLFEFLHLLTADNEALLDPLGVPGNSLVYFEEKFGLADAVLEILFGLGILLRDKHVVRESRKTGLEVENLVVVRLRGGAHHYLGSDSLLDIRFQLQQNRKGVAHLLRTVEVRVDASEEFFVKEDRTLQERIVVALNQ